MASKSYGGCLFFFLCYERASVFFFFPSNFLCHDSNTTHCVITNPMPYLLAVLRYLPSARHLCPPIERFFFFFCVCLAAWAPIFLFCAHFHLLITDRRNSIVHDSLCDVFVCKCELRTPCATINRGNQTRVCVCVPSMSDLHYIWVLVHFIPSIFRIFFFFLLFFLFFLPGFVRVPFNLFLGCFL